MADCNISLIKFIDVRRDELSYYSIFSQRIDDVHDVHHHLNYEAWMNKIS